MQKLAKTLPNLEWRITFCAASPCSIHVDHSIIVVTLYAHFLTCCHVLEGGEAPLHRQWWFIVHCITNSTYCTCPYTMLNESSKKIKIKKQKIKKNKKTKRKGVTILFQYGSYHSLTMNAYIYVAFALAAFVSRESIRNYYGRISQKMYPHPNDAMSFYDRPFIL